MTLSSASNPFVGLRPFESNESLLFFGRQEQTLELLQRLHKHHFVAVTGSSGSGKSSLIRAGLIPRLKAGFLVNDLDRWIISIMKPGESPLCNLAEAILSQVSYADESLSSTVLQKRITEEGVEAIVDILKPLKQYSTNFFLLIDQFEELFRFSPDHKDTEKTDEAVDFVNTFLELSAQTDLPVYIVLTMRSDFVGDCARFFGLPEAMNHSQYVVPRLNRVQLRKTIEGPVSLYNGIINAGLTARLLNDAQLLKDELPLLQHALMRIWDHNRNSDKSNELDIDDYESIGGIEKALSNHADEALQGMTKEEVSLTKKLFQALTSIDEKGRKVRRPARLSELEAITSVNRNTLLSTINRFIEGNRSFLIINELENKDDQIIDISHESLIRQWSTLNTWVDAEAESAKTFLRLVEASVLYEQKYKNLLMGNELHQHLHWYNSFNPGKSWAERYSANYESSILYLRQSELEEKNQRYKKIRNRRLLISATIAVILLISSFALWIYKNNIENKKELALNYWKSSQSARSEHNTLDALHFIAEAASLGNDKALNENLLIDGEAYLPLVCLKNIYIQNTIVNKAVFSNDGKWILISGNDGSVRILDKITGVQKGNVINNYRPVNSGVFSADGKWILTACSDNTARIFEAGSGRQIISFQHKGAVTDAVFSPNAAKVLTASADSTACTWEVATGNRTAIYKHEAAVTSAVFSPDGKSILTTARMTVSIWDTASKEKISSLEPEAIITSAVFSPDAKWILTSGKDSTAKIWEAENMKQVASLKHTDAVTQAVFSPDGKWILTASRDKNVRIWETATNRQIGPAMKHEGPVYSVAFSDDGRSFLTAGWDKTVRLWETSASAVVRENSFKHDGILNSALFDNEGKKIITAGYDSTARIWDVATKKQLHLFKHNGIVTTAVFSSDGKKVMTAGYDSTVRIWAAASGKEINTIKLEAAVNSAVFTANERSIITVGSDNYIKFFDLATGKETNSIKNKVAVTHADAGPAEKNILITSEDSSAHIINNSGQKMTSFKHEDAVNNSVFSPDFKWVVTASWDRTARLWNAATGKQSGPGMNHEAYVNSAIIDRDEKWILTAGWDSAAHLWSLATLKELGSPKKQNGVINSAVFSPDSRWILTAGYDSTARLWEIEGDLDLHADLFKLQAKVITGVEYDFKTSETQCIKPEIWNTLKEQYYGEAKDHYKICKYPQYNLWRRFNSEEAKQIRP